jgi:hypothetical protein
MAKGSIGGKEKMETFRDQLAEEMWRSYCDYTNRDYIPISRKANTDSSNTEYINIA